MAVPARSKDYDFAKKYGLPIRPVLSKRGAEAIEENFKSVSDGLGWMANSNLESFDGLHGNEAKGGVNIASEAMEQVMERYSTD